LSTVIADYQRSFGIGRIALVADRGLISAKNIADVTAHGFDHVFATRLRHDGSVGAVLERADRAIASAWVMVEGSLALDVVHEGTRYVVVTSEE
jgi:hypothetical protein